MDNLITVFMNYKINRLVAYAMFITEQNGDFEKHIFTEYFRTYVDNYYYHIFHTVDGDTYNISNLKLEFKGIMEDMLYDYRAQELVVSNEEYSHNCQLIRDMNPICFEIVKIDNLEFDSKDEIAQVVSTFIDGNSVLKELLGSRVSKLISLIRETYNTSLKLLSYEENYFQLEERNFEGKKDKVFYNLIPSIKTLDVYRNVTIYKVYRNKNLSLSKVRCLIQKVSFLLLKNLLDKKKSPLIFIEFPDAVIKRGKILDEILDLIDNPLFRQKVVIGVPFTMYQEAKEAFMEDYQFACIQDFTHISDVYQKTESVRQEGIFHYLIVSDCKYKNRDYFLDYHNESMEVLVFEEE